MLTLRLLSAAVLALALASCGGGDEPSLESITGPWTATRMEFTSVATGGRVDVIAEGATFTIDLSDTGEFFAALTLPGEAPETMNGTWSYTSDTITLQEVGSSGDLTFDLDMGNDAMTWSGADVDFDVDADGTDEPATLTIDLVRD